MQSDNLNQNTPAESDAPPDTSSEASDISNKDYSQYFNTLSRQYNSVSVSTKEVLSDEETGEEPNNEFLIETKAVTETETNISTRKSKFKSLPKFWKVYLSVCSAVLVLILGGLIYFWQYLGSYQKHLPINTCDIIAEAYRTTNSDKLIELCSNTPEVLKDKEKFSEYLKKYLDTDNVFYYEVGAPEEGKVKYIFKSDKKKIAELTLFDTGKKSFQGFSIYEIDNFTAYPLVSYTINCISGTAININGAAIDSKYLKEKTEVNEGFATALGTSITLDKYVLDDFNYIYDISASREDSKKCKIDFDEAASVYTVRFDENIEKSSEINDFCSDFLKKYMVFSTKRNGARQPVLNAIYPNTNFYDKTTMYSNVWGRVYDNDRFDNLKITDLTYYGSDCYSCNISVNYVTITPTEEKSYDFKQTLYLVNKNNRWYIVDMQPIV